MGSSLVGRRSHLGFLAGVLTLAACHPGARPAPKPAAAAVAVAPTTPAAPIVLGAEPAPTALHTTFTMPRGAVDHPQMGAIGFSEPMVALTALDTPAEIAGVTITPQVQLRFQWVGTDTLAWYPLAPLPGATTFTVTVGTELAALSGRKLPQPLTWTFKTPPPTLERSWPRDDEGDVAHGEPIVLLFSQKMDPASVDAALSVQTGKVKLSLAPVAWPTGTALRDLRKVIAADAEPATDAGFEGRIAVVRPATPWPGPARIDVTLAPGLHSLEGPEPSPKPQTLNFKTHGPFVVTTASCPDGCRPDRWAPVQVEFSNAISKKYEQEDLDRLVTLTPPLKDTSAGCWNNRCQPGGHFEAGKRYTLNISADLEDAHGQKLGKPFAYAFTTGHREPALDFATDGSVIELAEQKGKLGLQMTNITEVSLRAHLLDRAGLTGALHSLVPRYDDESQARPLPAVPIRFELPVPITANRKQDVAENRVFDAASVLGAGKPGLFVLDATSKQELDSKGGQRHHQRFFQVTDLHMTAKVSEAASLFWVTSFASGKPLPDVALEVQGEGGHVLWTGKTDAQGLAQGPGGLRMDRQTVPLALATLGADNAVLQLTDDERVDMGISGLQPVWEAPPRHRIFLFTDKNLYRLGDTVNIKAIVRDIGAAGLALPGPGELAQVEVLDPMDRVVSKASLPLSAQGTVATTALVPAFGAYGRYEVRVKAGGDQQTLAFSVAIYRAPKFESGVAITGAHHVQGEDVRGTMHANYYTGGAMGGAKAKFTAYGSPEPFDPPGWPKLQFSIHTSEDSGTARYLSQEGTGKTDERGTWAFHFGTNVAMDGPQRVEVESSMEDPNGRAVSATAAFWLHPATWSIGLGLASSVVRAGEPLKLDLATVQPEGAAVAGNAVHVQMLRREWKSVREKGMNDEYTWRTRRVETVVAEADVTTAAAPVSTLLTPPAAGYYVLRATGKDAGGHTTTSSLGFFATGQDAVAWNPQDDDTPMVIADKPSYAVGDVAHVLVKNPLPGVQALVTQERDRVLDTRLVTLATSTETIDVPITAAHVPNVFVSVTLFSGRRTPSVTAAQDTGAPTLKLGYLELPVDAKERRLVVTVKPAAARARPREDIRVDVQVKDAAGKGRPAEVTLMAVDEGVLALTHHATPDPFGAMYQPVPLGVRNYATIGDLVRGRVDEDKGETGGGGGDAGTRSRFKDVAFYAANLQADANGRVTAHFALPDNLTRYRLMAIAVDGPLHFGSGESAVQVDKPLMLLPSVPRTVQVGDHFEAAVTLRHQGSEPISGTLSCKAAAGLTLEGQADQAFSLKPGASVEKTCRASALAAGPTSITFTAQTPHDKQPADSVQEALEVLDPQPLESVASYGVAQGPVTQALQKPAQIAPTAGGLRVTAASTGVVGLEQGLAWLIAYPYGCTEQVASQLLALLEVEKLSKTFHLLPEKADKAATLIDGAIGRILDRRSGAQQGAFVLWPEGDTVEPAATAWALWVLWHAQSLGHTVEPVVLQRGAGWLKARLPAAMRARHTSDAAFDAERAMDLAVLARLGETAPGYLDELFAKRATLALPSQLWLAEALALGDGKNGTARAQRLLEELTRALLLDGETAHLPLGQTDDFQALWPSEVRSNAMLVDVMAAVQPDHPLLPRLVRWLVQRRQNDRYATTQENAWALQGLLRFFAATEQQPPDLTFAALLGQRKVIEGAWHGRSLEQKSAFVPQAELPAGTTPLQITRSGTGPLYYSLRYDYAPTRQAQIARNSGLLVRRTVLDQQGDIAPASLPRGDHVLVTLTVMADSQRDFVSIVDEVPAGLEPVDFDLATASQALRRKLAQLARGKLGAAAAEAAQETDSAAGSEFSHRELAGHEVRFFVDHLTPGVHTFAYVARAAVRGQFASHGTRAEAMYNPEVFGTSGPAAIQVE